MKKIKNILCLSIVALCSFCMIGIMHVNAQGSATNFKVVCDPASIEKGEIAQCFLIAQVNEQIDGVITKVYAEGSKNLNIQQVYSPKTKNYMSAEFVNSGASIKNDSTAKAATYECNSTTGCYIFYAKNGKAITADTSISDNGISALNGNTGFTLIGYYDVKLEDTATLKDCGRLCLEVSYSSAGDYSALEGNVDGAESPCGEIKPTGTPDTPTTGSFTSYIVLIGGAFLAIGAIALARKNNKFYRV